MVYVVTSACINCKHSTCVEVCPTDSFHEGPNMLVIHPEDCIDCAICVPECPENAIFAAEDVPHAELESIERNAELAERWPSIMKRNAPMSEHEMWRHTGPRWHLVQDYKEQTDA
jgi:ferredoxin